MPFIKLWPCSIFKK